MSRHRFNAASPDEEYVFGAQRPGYTSGRPVLDAEVDEWIGFMREQGIKRVCCLLEDELSYYESDLLAAYRRAFDEDALCWAPIEDYTYADETLLTEAILPFLATAADREEPVVVHCSGGIGRTGHVLAAWLVYGRGMSDQEAIDAVIAMGRNPFEAARPGAGGRAALEKLLDACRNKRDRFI